MSKTPLRSLRAIAVAAGLVVAQGAALTQQSSPVHAAGAAFISVTGVPSGSNTVLTVVGSGFTANSPVAVYFNAPPNPTHAAASASAGEGNGVGLHAPEPDQAAPSALAPAGPQPGDSNEAAGEPGGVPQPHGTGAVPLPPATTYVNTIEVNTISDAGGNLAVNPTGPFGPAVPAPPLPSCTTAAGCASNAAILTVPSSAVGAIYTITAVDASGAPGISASTTFTIAGNGQISVTPIGGGINTSAALGSEVTVTIQPSAITHGFTQFSLDGFAATNEPIGVVPPAGLFTPIPAAIPLKTIACSTGLGPTAASMPIGVGGPTFAAGTSTGCITDSSGAVVATVQLVNDTPPDAIHTTAGGATPMLFPDGVYALVATTTQTFNATPAPASYTTLATPRIVAAGVTLDHTLSRISLSTNQVPLGGSVTVFGTGFAANSTVELLFGGQQAASLFGAASPLAPGCAFAFSAGPPAQYISGASTVNPPVAPPLTNCLLKTVSSDASGNINTSVTLPGSTLASTSSGSILAEDFDAIAGAAPVAANFRLNEAALATVVINAAAINATLQLSTTTAAIGQSVSFTGTGFSPFENVVLTITNGGVTGCPTSSIISVQAGPPLVGGGNSANVAGTFLVPNSVCTNVPTTTNGLTHNAGTTVVVSATGSGSAVVDNANLAIPATSAAITLLPPPPSLATSAVITGTGFQANEQVSVSFGTADPFTGAITSITAIPGVADGNGNVTISTPIPAGGATGLFAVVVKGLVSGFAVQAVQVVTSGQVTLTSLTGVPITTALPGQQFLVNGTGFSSTGTPSLFSPGAGVGTVSINWAPTPLPATPITISTGGTFVFTATVPLNTVPGAYSVTVTAPVASGASSQSRSVPITITAGVTTTLVLSAGTTANLGATIPVSVTGFAPGEPVTVEFDFGPTSPLSGTAVPGTVLPLGTADANGNLQGTYTIPLSLATLPPGQYVLVVRGTQTARTASSLFILNPSTASTSGVSAIYFPEGFTGTTAGGSSANFTETLNILNANNYTTTYTVTYFVLGASATSIFTNTIGADSVVTRTVNLDVGSDKQVASEVSSPAPLAASRNIWRTDASGNALDASSSLGVQLDTVSAVPTGGDNYYFATSDVQLTNEEYLSLLNPTATSQTVTINVLPQSPLSSTTVPTIAPITVNVPAMSRVTEAIRKAVASSGITAFGLAINSTGPTAIERVEYYGDGIGSAKFGADTKPAVAGMGFRQYIFGADYGTAPSTGGTAGVGTGNDLSEVDIINPGMAAAGSATVTVSFFGPDGSPINSQQVQVDGGTRDTVAVNDVVGTQANVFSVVVTSDKAILAELPISFGGDPSKGGQFGVANPSGAPAGLTSVAFPNLNTSMTNPLSATTVVSQTVNLYNPGASTITVRGIYVSGTHMVNKTYTVAPNAITAVNVNADSAGLPAGPIGGLFQIVSTGAGSSDSFVAELVSASPDWKSVTADQGTYPTSAATGL